MAVRTFSTSGSPFDLLSSADTRPATSARSGAISQSRRTRKTMVRPSPRFSPPGPGGARPRRLAAVTGRSTGKPARRNRPRVHWCSGGPQSVSGGSRMAVESSGGALASLRLYLAAQTPPDVPDRELLGRFLGRQDEAAFAAL